jgi:hypothetical protein
MTRYLLLFDSYSLVFRGAPSLMRGWVCLLYTLLALVSAVFNGSESLGTCDHILLSQIWEFPFRRLLRLAGSRWRYSTPPPHGLTGIPRYIASRRTPRKTFSQQFLGIFTAPLPRNWRPSIVESVTLRLFTEPLPSNGHMRHNTLETSLLLNELKKNIPNEILHV